MQPHRARKPITTTPYRIDCGDSCVVTIKRKFVSLIVTGCICLESGCQSLSAYRSTLSGSPSHGSQIARKTTSATAADRRIAINTESANTKSSAKIRLTNAEDDQTVSVPELQETTSTIVIPQDVGATEIELPQSMTLEELEALALQNNPTLSQAQAAVTGQLGLRLQASLYPNPQLGYLNGTSSKASVKQSNAIYASQEFVTANKLGLATQAASEELKRYQWDYEAQRMRVINDLKIRFYEVLGAQESVRLHRELVEIAEHNLDIAKTLLETKFVSQGEVLQAEIQRDAVEVFLFEANMRFEAGWEQLIAMAGLNSMKPVPLVGNLNENLPELDSNTCWQNLISNSPQIKAAEAELSHGLITINENRALGVPNFTVQTVVEYDQATQSTNASTLFALPLPLHNWNQGNTDKAIADVVADRADICRIYRVLQDSHTLSFQKYRTRLKECQSLKDVIIPKSKRALDLTQIAFENRQTSVSPVLAAQQSYFRSRIAYIDALTELHKTVVEIEGLQLTGGLNPAAIGSAIQSAPGGGGVQRQRALLNQLQENNTRTLMNAAQITQ